MAEFEVDCSKIKSEASEIYAIYKEINSLKRTVERCKVMIASCMEGAGCSNIKKSLDASIRGLEQQAIKLSKLSAGLQQVSSTYNKNESLISNKKDSLAPVAEASASIPKDIVKFNIKEYTKKVSDAEYARLCYLTYGALKRSDPARAFVDLVKKDDYLPDNDIIKNISPNQVSVVEVYNGFSAFIITSGNSAIVIFAGTNGASDYDDDALLALGLPNVQEQQAIALVNRLSDKYSDITVTGHSLGGYMATAATLCNKSVDRCISFDAPGRQFDVGLQELFNKKQTSKITTYEAKGSFVSSVGSATGEVRKVRVESNGSFLDKNHGIVQLCDGIGGRDAIRDSWN